MITGAAAGRHDAFWTADEPPSGRTGVQPLDSEPFGDAVPSRLARDLAGLFRRYGVVYGPGDVMVREGDTTAELYVLLKGATEFSVHDPHTGERRVLRTAGPGEIFGEVACFAGVPRTATATALTRTCVLRFDRAAAVELVRRSPDFALHLLRLLARRLSTQEQSGAEHQVGAPSAAATTLSVDECLAALGR